MSVAAILVGGGQGKRLARSLPAHPAERVDSPSLPKALLPLAGAPMLVWAARALIASGEVDTVVPVVPGAWIDRLPEVAPELGTMDRVARPVAGGAERQDSVRAGLESLDPGAELVAVHDAARPLVAPGDVARVIRAARRSGAALLAVPVTDTIKRVRGLRVIETLPREECFAAQTPQVFRVDWLREAHERARREGATLTDDAQAVERLGRAVEVVPGDPQNVKITRGEDFAHAERILAADGGRR